MTVYDQEILKDLLRKYHARDLEFEAEMKNLQNSPAAIHCGGLSLGYRHAAMMLIEAMQKLGIKT